MNQNVKAVINILKRDVPAPWVYPEFNKRLDCLRWVDIYSDRFCPMGLHFEAIISEPNNPKDFFKSILTVEQINDFISWWDNLIDPKKAYKAIWG